MTNQTSMQSIIAALLVLCCLGQAATVAAEDTKGKAKNVVPNSSFAKADGEKPAGWKAQTWGGKAAFEYARPGRGGDDRCVKITSTEGGDVCWNTNVEIRPFSTYRLSGWIKTENLKTRGSAHGAMFNIHGITAAQTKAISGNNDWTKVEMVFDSGPNDSALINCLFGGWGLATGTAWFDDVKLQPLKIKEFKLGVTIDATKVGEPISPYIYGQFIEHLGRCINGGIWAEMLEDRKFHDPVDAKGSPWQSLDKDSVAMVKEDSFVGEHTPKIAAGKGIRQSGLGVVKGKDYDGYIWLKSAGQPATVQVSLAWSSGKSQTDPRTITISNVAGEYTRYPLKFTARATTDEATLSIEAEKGSPLVGTVSLMPADNIQGMRHDTLALLKELDSTVYRWPGGNFVSGYDWKDGIGPRDRRPPRKNPAWKGIEHNDFGLDEFMAFCKLLETEPYIAVNSGLGGLKNAIEELQYSNGPADSPMGKLRVKNGHPQPYKVKWWGIGNEMYGGWQLGHMPLEDYIKKHNQFAEAMRKEDPKVMLVAVGSTGKWSEGMMQHCADHMDLVSEHFYCQGKQGLIGHVYQIPSQVHGKAEMHRKYRKQFDSLKGKNIRIALDEWNYWYGPHVYGQLGTRYFLKDALGIAAGLNEYARCSDIIFMANYAQTVNVIGCIKTSKTQAAFATTGLALKLYRKHFGTLPLATESGLPVDAMAALSADRKTLTIAVVNPTMKPVDVPLTLKGVKLSGKGKRWRIAGDDPMAYNEPGKPPKVTIEESAANDISDKLPVAACSITLFSLELK